MLLTAADGRQCRQADGDVGDKPGTPSRAAEVRSGCITWLGRGHVVTIGLQVAAQPTLVRRAVSIRFGFRPPSAYYDHDLSHCFSRGKPTDRLVRSL